MKTELSLTNFIYIIIAVLSFLIALTLTTLVNEIERIHSVNVSFILK